MRPSDLYDNLHTDLRFSKNNHTFRKTQECILSKLLGNIQVYIRILEFNYISKSYHSSLSYIKGRKQSSGGVLLKSVIRNFAKFAGKHLTSIGVFQTTKGLEKERETETETEREHPADAF